VEPGVPKLPLLLALTAVTGCLADEATSSAEQPLVEGSPEARGILLLLTDGATTFALLDDAVGLDRRAAAHLIAHRDGGDGVPGTADDDGFDTIAEVDAVPYVAASALDKLRAYAVAHGFVSSGDDLLGVFDNVAFTVDEAAATLALVNAASVGMLDIEVALDGRAASNIIAARPIADMPKLAAVSYVGHSAMLALREYAKAHTPTPGGPASIGEPCAAHAECGSGLCAGLLTPWLAPNGLCMPADSANTFTTSSSIGIPDNGSSSLIYALPVRNLLTVPLDVVIDLDIAHPRKQDLVVVLYQPGGAQAVLWNHEANPPSHIVAPAGIEGDNSVNGDWQLKITDTVPGAQGSLVKWSMWISSNWD
jgi:hypothetical protein